MVSHYVKLWQRNSDHFDSSREVLAFRVSGLSDRSFFLVALILNRRSKTYINRRPQSVFAVHNSWSHLCRTALSESKAEITYCLRTHLSRSIYSPGGRWNSKSRNIYHAIMTAHRRTRRMYILRIEYDLSYRFKISQATKRDRALTDFPLSSLSYVRLGTSSSYKKMQCEVDEDDNKN